MRSGHDNAAFQHLHELNHKTGLWALQKVEIAIAFKETRFDEDQASGRPG